MGRFLQTPRLSASIDPRRGGGVRKHSASTSPFLTWSPLLICPQHEMPAQESTTCRAGLSGARRLSGDQEVSSGLPCLALRPNWEDCGSSPPSPREEGRRGVLPGVVSPWPAARGHLTLHSPALVSAAPAGSGNSAQEQWSHSSGLGFAQ